MTAIEELARNLSRLPGIGPKTAARLAYHLIKTDALFNKTLAEQIASIQDRIRPCSICGSYTEADPCEYCSDHTRDASLLCIVEQPQDVVTIASSGVYNGLFHVLGGAINPLEGIGPQQLSFASLEKRVAEGSFKELIIATNPTDEGDTTALFIKSLFSKCEGLVITRLASGLPIGGDLEYADRLTLARSMRGRTTIQ
ncbi:MAG: recombination mediator RecR [Sphaerochaetaceae bacterium]